MVQRGKSMRINIPGINQMCWIHISLNEIYNENLNFEGSECLNFACVIVARDDDHALI